MFSKAQDFFLQDDTLVVSRCSSWSIGTSYVLVMVIQLIGIELGDRVEISPKAQTQKGEEGLAWGQWCRLHHWSPN